MESFVIEKGIPCPFKPQAPNQAEQLRLPELRVGQSVFVPKDQDVPLQKFGNRIRRAVSDFQRTTKDNGKVFTTNLLDNGIRIWRIK
jgi:hypothetical protein